MTTRVLASAVNLHGAAVALALSARRRQVAPSTEARAQHLGEMEAMASMLNGMGLTGGLDGTDVVAIVTLSQPVGRVPEVGGAGLTTYLDTWAITVAWMLGWTQDDLARGLVSDPEGENP